MSIKVTDPVCGMQVDPAKSKGSFEHKGTTYHFCGLRCLEKFKNDPDGILARGVPIREPAKTSAPAPIAAGAPLYTCPMHPEIRQDHPGSCPRCGMALEPVAPVLPVSKTEYVCPMHSQIVRAEPGNCPICGMALEPRVAVAGEEASPELLDMTRRFWI
ncbi:heavy metal-binding domain-containing protein, partial [Candidatus Binatus sp.]|uniref:heavy metal-binding domain-containing protein n=1 Tax=Candidatus Binatus sp. TaxID=2811406 RepID=UPI003C3417E3